MGRVVLQRRIEFDSGLGRFAIPICFTPYLCFFLQLESDYP